MRRAGSCSFSSVKEEQLPEKENMNEAVILQAIDWTQLPCAASNIYVLGLLKLDKDKIQFIQITLYIIYFSTLTIYKPMAQKRVIS